jgi:hypothetical protein
MDSLLSMWWPCSVTHLTCSDAKVANSAIMLVLRCMWLERNVRVFNDHATLGWRVVFDDVVQGGAFSSLVGVG